MRIYGYPCLECHGLRVLFLLIASVIERHQSNDIVVRIFLVLCSCLTTACR